jgi:hypothetical protein
LAAVLLESAIPDLIKQLPEQQGLLDAVAKLTVSAVVGAVQPKFNIGDSSSVSVDVGKFLTAMQQVFAADRGQGPPLQQVLTAYTSLLACWDKARAANRLRDSRPPVLVLDEANVLTEWAPQHEADRKALLRFFVTVSKAKNQSHILLATSEYAFQSWLAAGKAATAFQHH